MLITLNITKKATKILKIDYNFSKYHNLGHMLIIWINKNQASSSFSDFFSSLNLRNKFWNIVVEFRILKSSN